MKDIIIFNDGAELEIISHYSANIPMKQNEVFRETVVLTFAADYATVAGLFVDGADYFKRTIYEDEQFINEDLSVFNLAGRIIDNRDGTVTVYMHKPTPDELRISELQDTVDMLVLEALAGGDE